MPLIFNSVDEWTEQVGRRTTQRFGTVTNYIFVYTGPQSAYTSWNPQLGSNPPGFPLLYLSNIEKRNMAGGVMEVTLSYVGTDKQQAQYSDLNIHTDLAYKTFSWSGYAKVASGGATPYIAQVTLTFTFTTTEATFSYTSYGHPGSALFQDMATGYIGVILAYGIMTYGAVQVGVGPTVGPPYNPVQTLTRHTCEQLTPNPNGPWKCSETWSKDYNMGTLGFPNVTA